MSKKDAFTTDKDLDIRYHEYPLELWSGRHKQAFAKADDLWTIVCHRRDGVDLENAQREIIMQEASWMKEEHRKKEEEEREEGAAAAAALAAEQHMVAEDGEDLEHNSVEDKVTDACPVEAESQDPPPNNNEATDTLPQGEATGTEALQDDILDPQSSQTGFHDDATPTD